MKNPSQLLRRPLALAALAAVALGGIHCGDPVFSNDLPPIAKECENTEGGGCSCVDSWQEGNGRTCSAKSVRGTCCADDESCTCYALGCVTDSAGCSCGVHPSAEVSCSPPSGVCCARPGNSNDDPCRCYFDLGVCPAGTNPIANCSISSLTCGLLGSYGEPTTACSKVVQK